ncbi:MAG: M15 family metallopeptidase [Candidatus Adiutrix sp.]|jgi:peptidoglycan L-alanyl-D-glutamate endopeptidase CwlK|nr:M15 family metallopeptidase [Candidatus Adiutrix sp.]
MAFQLSPASLSRLQGVHPDLVKVVRRAIEITETDMTVLEGLRSIGTQRRYVARGVSRTMNSKHLIQPDGYGHAVDIYPFVNGRTVNDWIVPWLTKAESAKCWADVASAMKAAAAELAVRITWGGDWTTFKDGPHWSLA